MPQETSTPQSSNDFVKDAAEAARRRNRRGRVVSAVVGGVVAVSANEAMGDPFGTAVENLTTPNTIVQVGTVSETSDGLIADTDHEAHQLVLEAKVDPSRVDFNTNEVLADVPKGDKNFTMALIDDGSTYFFEYVPAQNPPEVPVSTEVEQIPSPQFSNEGVNDGTVPLPGSDTKTN